MAEMRAIPERPEWLRKFGLLTESNPTMGLLFGGLGDWANKVYWDEKPSYLDNVMAGLDIPLGGVAKAAAPVIAGGAGLLSMMKMGGKPAGLLAKAHPKQVGAIGWHGSPHKWDAPDISKVGTGEGAQAYGHGFYSAEGYGTADWYRRNLSEPPEELLTSKGEEAFNSYLDDWAAKSAEPLRTYKANQETIRQLTKEMEFQRGIVAKEGISDNWFDEFLIGKDIPQSDASKKYSSISNKIDQLMAEQRNLSSKNVAIQNQIDPDVYMQDLRGAWGRDQYFDFANQNFGNKDLFNDYGYLYKLDIPDEDIARYLDWDKPLSEQSDHIKSIFDPGDYPETFTGSSLYDRMAGSPGINPGRSRYLPNGGREGQDLVSSHLNKLGIPGIRYLDGASRNAGQGTYNYVTFDPSRITVLERNGVPIKGLLK